MSLINCRSEFAPLKTVILCQPTNMSIKDTINDIQAHYEKENINQKLAIVEHGQLTQVLEEQKIEVKFIPLDKNCPEQVFTRDIGFVIEETLYVGNLKREIRKKESDCLIDFLQKEKIPYTKIEVGTIEGGDVIVHKNQVFIGDSSRTAKATVDALAKGHPEHTFHLIDFDDRFLHLDCVFNPISEKEALIYPKAISAESLVILKKQFDLIEVTTQEQFTLAVNVLSIGQKKVIALPKNRETNDKLRQRGYDIIEVDFSEIIKSGGSFRCVTLPIERM
ncbi:dimethylarginine dimethylaminohydrolase family protein [Alkalihalobacillus sp. 1P02AB]|uniref:dimethylarginine dimethylaminohydrolase family protein n=1 Tax=Alkalihalobacillus sp. 1P02AB TaxID=3132260 RepID=UPI0039A6E439